MSETDPPPPSSRSPRAVKRRSVIGAALAGTGVAVASAVTAAAPASAATPTGSPFIQVLPFRASQPTGTALTLLGTSGGPQAEYGRCGTSSVLTVEGYNYLIDAGRSSVTQYLNSGLEFKQLQAMFVTHLHADHLGDFYNYFLMEGGQPNAEKDRLAYPPGSNPSLKPQRPFYVFGPGSAGALPVDPADPEIIAPNNPVPGTKDLIARLNEGYAYSYNVFERGDGTQPITLLQQNITEIAIPASVGASSTNTAPLMQPFEVYKDERVRVCAILVPHGSVFPCFAYRFETAKGVVVFSGDTSCANLPDSPKIDPAANNVITLARGADIGRGADILVHEVMNWDLILANFRLVNGKDAPLSPLLNHLYGSHTRADQVGQVAAAAGVPMLALTHLIPSNPVDCPDFVWKSIIAKDYAGKIHVGNDRDRIALPVRR